MAIRTEQTLRRMWDESVKLTAEAGNLWATADGSRTEAEVAERTAAAHRKAEESARNVGDAMASEAADLVDMVNEKRSAMGLSKLTPGEPYPADPAPAGVVPAEQPMADDTLVASGQSAATTAVDGQGVTGEVAS